MVRLGQARRTLQGISLFFSISDFTKGDLDKGISWAPGLSHPQGGSRYAGYKGSSTLFQEAPFDREDRDMMERPTPDPLCVVGARAVMDAWPRGKFVLCRTLFRHRAMTRHTAVQSHD